MRIETDKIYCGDSLQVLQTLPENAVDCCVTSPPYYALRDYGADGQIGRTGATFGVLFESIFDDAIFERMIADDRDASPWSKPTDRRF